MVPSAEVVDEEVVVCADVKVCSVVAVNLLAVYLNKEILWCVVFQFGTVLVVFLFVEIISSVVDI